MSKLYHVNEIFYSIQGEGVRAGTANRFLRFSGCNLKCSKETEGFDCDTEFVSGRDMTADEIVEELKIVPKRTCNLDPDDDVHPWVILTGGEPALQVDNDLLLAIRRAGFKIAIETNGTIPLGLKYTEYFDWVVVSPKTAEHTIKQLHAHEVRYVRAHGQGIPKTTVRAQYYMISPAFEGNEPNMENIRWCVKLVKENPTWRLSLQTHKLLGVR